MSTNARSRRPARRPLCLEPLEDRCVPASIAGVVFLDQNDNGARDPGEPGLGSVIIYLTGLDVNSQPVNKVLATAATGPVGNFLFDDLPAGTYTLREEQPLQFNDGRDAVGSAGGALGNDRIDVIVLQAETQATGYSFSERGASLGGVVFLDRDGDGVRGPDESGLPGVAIELRDQNNTTSLGTTTTAADGSYRFDHLEAGVYNVVQTQPAGLRTSTPNVFTTTVTVAGLSGQNFGEVPGRLTGLVFRDDNANGTREANEPGIAGVTVTLTGTDAAGRPVNRTAITALDGTYVFDDLVGGNYTLTSSPRTGYVAGIARSGTAGGTVADGRITDINLGNGVAATGYTFAELLVTAPLSGVVFLDININGQQDPGEAGVAGRLLTLRDAKGQAVAVATTDDGGRYLFSVPPGRYVLVQEQPALRLSTTPNHVPVTVPTAGRSGQDFGETDAVTAVARGRLLASTLGQSLGERRGLADYVAQLYRDVLNREPSPAEVASWVGHLLRGFDVKTVARAVWVSPEHRGLQVDDYYRRFLGRDADPAGRAHFVRAFLAGATEEDVLEMFVTSSEYAARHAGDEAFLQAVFTDVLGRPLDDGSREFWLPLLRSPGQRETVVRMILHSPESEAQQVRAAYQTVLGRSADADGLTYWAGRLRAGLSLTELATLFLAGQEFGARVPV